MRYRRSAWKVIVLLGLWTICSPAPLVLAQVPFGLGGDNPESDTSRTPFRIKLSGFINTRPEENSVAVVTLG
ncbi:MAG: hypothetical protein NZ578_10120, partial [Candidatus Binatia bacterium]|nr:hypothetical protein [Candidatus Binatia bacterium]